LELVISIISQTPFERMPKFEKFESQIERN
jgi:hypothetical protein